MKIEWDIVKRFLNKQVRIICTGELEVAGELTAYESPQDSEDGYWWLDVIIDNGNYVTIQENEIVEIIEVF